MRRNLVGKKPPQVLTARGYHSGFIDWSGLTSIDPITDHHDATVGTWTHGNDVSNTGNKVYVQVNDPSVPFERNDLLAVSEVLLSHMSGTYISYPDIASSNPMPALGYVSASDAGYNGEYQRYNDSFSPFVIGAGEIVSNATGGAAINADGKLELPAGSSIDLGAAGITWTRGGVLLKTAYLDPSEDADITWTSGGVTHSVSSDDYKYKDGYVSGSGYFHVGLPVDSSSGGTLTVTTGSMIIEEVHCVHEDPNSTAIQGGGQAFMLLGGTQNPVIVDRTTNVAHQVSGVHLVHEEVAGNRTPLDIPGWLSGYPTASGTTGTLVIDVNKACDAHNIDPENADFYVSVPITFRAKSDIEGNQLTYYDAEGTHPQKENLKWFREGQVRHCFSSVTVNVGDTWDEDMAVNVHAVNYLEGNSRDTRWGDTNTDIDTKEWLMTPVDTDPNGFTASSETIVLSCYFGVAYNLPGTPNLVTSLPSDYQYASILLDNIGFGQAPSQSPSYEEHYGDVGRAPYSEWYNNGNWYMESSADVHNWPDLEELFTFNARKFGFVQHFIAVIG